MAMRRRDQSPSACWVASLRAPLSAYAEACSCPTPPRWRPQGGGLPRLVAASGHMEAVTHSCGREEAPPEVGRHTGGVWVVR